MDGLKACGEDTRFCPAMSQVFMYVLNKAFLDVIPTSMVVVLKKK